MASVHLSYGEDLQIDWDGRGRLLVKVGALGSSASSPQPDLQNPHSAPVGRCLRGRRTPFSLSPEPQSKEWASLVCERLVFAV